MEPARLIYSFGKMIESDFADMCGTNIKLNFGPSEVRVPQLRWPLFLLFFFFFFLSPFFILLFPPLLFLQKRGCTRVMKFYRGFLVTKIGFEAKKNSGGPPPPSPIENIRRR